MVKPSLERWSRAAFFFLSLRRVFSRVGLGAGVFRGPAGRGSTGDLSDRLETDCCARSEQEQEGSAWVGPWRAVALEDPGVGLKGFSDILWISKTCMQQNGQRVYLLNLQVRADITCEGET